MPALLAHPIRRLLVLIVALAWLAVGIAGAYQYVHRYSLYRGFPVPVTPKGVPRGSLHEVHFTSSVLGGRHSFLIYLPPHYRRLAARGHRFPVLYLLHGDPGSPYVFPRAGALEVEENVLLKRRLIRPMIVVMPSGRSGLFGGSGTEWANAGAGLYEDYVVEVMRHIDAHYATIRNRQARGIGGLSEGGFGALNITLHHLDLFSVAESWSGYFREFRTGPFSHSSYALIRYNSPVLLVPQIAARIRSLGYRAWLYQGQVDSQKPAHIQTMAARLHAAGAEVHYAFFPGGHDWGLWRAQLPRMLMAASHWFATPPRQGAGTLTASGHGGTRAAVLRYLRQRYRLCLKRRAAALRAGRSPGHPCNPPPSH